MTTRNRSLSFISELKHKLRKSKSNHFGFENASIYTKSEFVRNPLRVGLKQLVKKRLSYFKICYHFRSHFERLMDILDEQSGNLLIELLAYRIAGFRKIKLSLNTDLYWERLHKVESMAVVSTGAVVSIFSGLRRFDLREIGYDVTIDLTTDGIMTDFVLEQYACKNEIVVEASRGDTVLDIGGCWGDTGLYFAQKVCSNGHVYSFEFIPRNLEVLRSNLELNPHLKDRVTVVENPVFNISGLPIYFQDKGQGSSVKNRPFKKMTGTAKTISIDDFVDYLGIKVDYIKMDIEGAELLALQGARETIIKFKPKLAIAIYHSIGDMARIPNWIDDLKLGYKLQLGHFTIFDEETVCFATVD